MKRIKGFGKDSIKFKGSKGSGKNQSNVKDQRAWERFYQMVKGFGKDSIKCKGSKASGKIQSKVKDQRVKERFNQM